MVHVGKTPIHTKQMFKVVLKEKKEKGGGGGRKKVRKRKTTRGGDGGGVGRLPEARGLSPTA